jgi:biopolymer transport protein TolR
MAMSGGGDAGRGQLNSEINVTPMVDVMLVLLVIFMITAPLLNTGVEVDLPDTNTKPVKDPKGKPTLSITRELGLFIGGERVEWSGLADALRGRGQMDELQIEADKDLPYAVVVTAMAVAQQAGVGKLQLLSDPGAQLDLRALDSGEVERGTPEDAVVPPGGQPPAGAQPPARGQQPGQPGETPGEQPAAGDVR